MSSGEMNAPPQVVLAAHSQKIKNLESREEENREWREGQTRWREEHTREDDQRHSVLGGDVTRVIDGLNTLNKTLEPIIVSYWGADSSKVTNASTPAKRKRAAMSPEFRQSGIVAALVTVVIALVEVIKAYAHPEPPPPPNTAQIAAEVAKAILSATPKERP